MDKGPDRILIDDVELVLTRPVEQDLEWIGQEELVAQILASWLVIGERDLPLCPRLLGKPGVGKTTLAYHAARQAGLAPYIHQCTVDTRPEDLLVTPVLSRDGKIAYHASPLVTAMIRGGAVILDEANRMSEKSWASLAPLLDHRRYVESIVAGIRIPAHPAFRACITMNDDASTYEIPDYMLSRIQPAVVVEFPEREEEFRILKYHLPFAPDEVLALTVDFLQEGHQRGLGYSTRDGINIARYALKLRSHPGGSAVFSPLNPGLSPLGPPGGTKGGTAKGAAAHGAASSLKDLFELAVKRILGDDAMDWKRQELKKQPLKFMDLREFFEMVEGLGGEPDAGGGKGEGGTSGKTEKPEDPDGPGRKPRKR